MHAYASVYGGIQLYVHVWRSEVNTRTLALPFTTIFFSRKGKFLFQHISVYTLIKGQHTVFCYHNTVLGHCGNKIVTALSFDSGNRYEFILHIDR